MYTVQLSAMIGLMQAACVARDYSGARRLDVPAVVGDVVVVVVVVEVEKMSNLPRSRQVQHFSKLKVPIRRISERNLWRACNELWEKSEAAELHTASRKGEDELKKRIMFLDRAKNVTSCLYYM